MTFAYIIRISNIPKEASPEQIAVLDQMDAISAREYDLEYAQWVMDVCYDNNQDRAFWQAELEKDKSFY